MTYWGHYGEMIKKPWNSLLEAAKLPTSKMNTVNKTTTGIIS